MFDLVEDVVSRAAQINDPTLSDIEEADRAARAAVAECLAHRSMSFVPN